MFARKRLYIPIMVFAFLVTVITTFQNCSDVNFETTDELQKAGIDGTLRQISFSPKFNENRPNIDVTTVLDNSNSMTKIQGQVKTAVSSTTSALKGFSGTVNLYSTTQELNHPARNRDTINYYKIQNDKGSLVPSTNFTDTDLIDYKNDFDNSGNPIFSTYEKWTRFVNFSPFRSIPFSAQMNDIQFKSFQNDVYNEIAKIDVSGSQTEVTLCSLIRNIDAYKDSSDFHTYILATNEDDQSTIDNCLRSEGQRWDRTSTPRTGASIECDDTDPACTFAYSVSYKDEKWSRLVYKQSYTEKEQFVFNLTNNKLKTNTIQISHKTARRLARHYLKQNSWQFKYQRNVKVGENDGVPIYNLQTSEVNHNGKPAAIGACSGASTTYKACTGTDLNYFNANVAPSYLDLVPGSCEVKCNNGNTNWLYDWIDTSNVAVDANNITYPASVTSASLAGYNSGCQSWVSSRRNYNATGVDGSDFLDCQLTYASDGNLSNIGFTSTLTNNDTSKSFGVCAASVSSCSAAVKSAQISTAGWGSIDSTLISCNDYCSVNELRTTLNSSTEGVKRLTANQLCDGKSIGDNDATVELSCNAGEKTIAKNKLKLLLQANGISNPTVNDADLACTYQCVHRKGGEQSIVGSDIKLDPWASPANEIRSCSESEFTSLGKANLHSCQKVYYDKNAKANISFNSKNGAICGANSNDPAPTLSSIMAYPDAASVVDYGLDQPLKFCSVARFADGRSKGIKGGAEYIEYNWAASNIINDSFISSEGVVSSVTEMLKKAHGGNFFIAAFINDPSQESTACKGVNLADYYGPSQSVVYEGKKFKELAATLGPKRMKTFPACMPDYEEAMKFVFDLIVTTASRLYKLPLDEKAQEWIYRIKILDNKGLVHSLKEDEFSWENGLLTIKEGIDLDSAEVIYVDIVVPNPLTI
ncbi:MAG: hypothetical protein H6625_01925 [Bdellovibrionaceae bacterium]|nr:hypothetical protein [Pseudobdellovibrionaceae bacterium]